MANIQNLERKCGDCSRRKFYQIGYKDGLKDGQEVTGSTKWYKENYKEVCGLIYKIAEAFIPGHAASLDCDGDGTKACELLANEIIKFVKKKENNI